MFFAYLKVLIVPSLFERLNSPCIMLIHQCKLNSQLMLSCKSKPLTPSALILFTWKVNLALLERCQIKLLGGLFLRWAWGSSGSAKMLDAILSLRGVEFSSAPKVKLDSPPGGRSTLNGNKWQIIPSVDGHPVSTALPSPLPLSLFVSLCLYLFGPN